MSPNLVARSPGRDSAGDPWTAPYAGWVTRDTGLLTDRYELTMLRAALRDGTADRRCVFEVFARRLPDGRRYGVVAGTARVLEAVDAFRFDDETGELLRAGGAGDDATPEDLRRFRLTGGNDGHPQGELYFP